MRTVMVDVDTALEFLQRLFLARIEFNANGAHRVRALPVPFSSSIQLAQNLA